MGDYLTTILTPREQRSIHLNISCFFSPQMQLGELGAFFLTLRDSIFAPQEHLGDHFDISGAPWVVILVSRKHLGKQFWYLGTTLEDHSNSRMDTKLQITGFLSILV